MLDYIFIKSKLLDIDEELKQLSIILKKKKTYKKFPPIELKIYSSCFVCY